MDVEGDRAAVSIVGGDLSQLVGRDGEVLEALQELTRLAVYRETGERSRLMLDIGGFRADKRTRLEKVADEAVAEVEASGERKVAGPDDARSSARSCTTRSPRPGCARSPRARSPAGASWCCPRDGSRPVTDPTEPVFHVKHPPCPTSARGVFAARLDLAEAYADLLADRRGGPRPDRPAGGAPAVGPAPAELRGAGRRAPRRAPTCATSAPAPACRAWCWRSAGRTCG